MKNITTSRKGGEKKENILFDAIGRILALYCYSHTDCKQQHFLTRKQTQNPPIKLDFAPTSSYSGGFFQILSSFFFFVLA